MTVYEDSALEDDIAPEATAPERAIAFVLFAALLFINVSLIGLNFSGYPVRALLALAILGAVVVLYPDRTLQVVRQQGPVLVMAAIIAILGSFVSFANGTQASIVWKGAQEVPIQVAVTLVAASVLAQIAGRWPSVWAIVIVIGGSAGVAMLQNFGFEPAWQLREKLGALQDEVVPTPLANRRPMGTSYSPIQLSTQLCIAFAVFAAARERTYVLAGERPPADFLVLLAAAILAIGSLLTMTRSPILGCALFLAIYMLRRPGSWLVFAALLGMLVVALVGPLLLEAVQDTAPRVARADDNSVLSRVSMNIYGVMLFLDNPLGYGWAFSPSDHYAAFWRDLSATPAPGALAEKELHNYFLNMLNTYGIGLVLVLPLAYFLLRRSSAVLIFFIPYIVHITFHNSGPFWNDIPFWFGIAALCAIPSGAQNTLPDYRDR